MKSSGRPTQRINSEEIGRLYTAEKQSIRWIAMRLGVSRDFIRTRLKEAGIRLRSGDVAQPPRPATIPYGWRRENGHLIPYQAEQKVIAKMKRDRADGHSLHEIARELTDLGIKTKNGGRWHAKTVSQILKFNEKK